MFSRDPILPLNTLLAPKCQYLGNDVNLLSLEALKNMFEIVATNLKKACSRRDPNTPQLPIQLKEGDRVLIKNQTAGPFDPKYIGSYRIVSVKGNQVEIRPAEGGKTRMEHVSNVKYILPAEKYIEQLPEYENFGCKSRLRLNPDKIPDLNWKWHQELNTTSIGQIVTINSVYMNHCKEPSTYKL